MESTKRVVRGFCVMALALVTGCGDSGVNFQPEEPDQAPAVDMSTSADQGMDLGDLTGEDTPPDEAPDEAPEPCGGSCTGELPRCDVERDVCVGCLADVDCARAELLNVLAVCEPELQACVYACESEAWQVEPGQTVEADGCQCAPTDEVCDGVDDDCDGEVDEGLEPLACAKQAGVCAGAMSVCAGVLERYSATCDEALYAAHAATYQIDDLEALRCDGLDNDCDGEVDEACCAQNMQARVVRVAGASVEDNPVLIRASPARPGAAYLVAYRSLVNEITMVELDAGLNEVWRGRHAFTDDHLASLSVAATPDGYLLGFTARSAQNPTGAFNRVRIFDVTASALSVSNTTAFLSNISPTQLFNALDLNFSIPKLRLVTHQDELFIAMSWEVKDLTPGDNARYWTRCFTRLSALGAGADTCVKAAPTGHEEVLGVRVRDSNNRYELDVEQRGERVLATWYHRSASDVVANEVIYTSKVSGADPQRFSVSYLGGADQNTLRPHHRLTFWKDDASFISIFRARVSSSNNPYYHAEVRLDGPDFVESTYVDGRNLKRLAAISLDPDRDGAYDAFFELSHNSFSATPGAFFRKITPYATPDTASVSASIVPIDRANEVRARLLRAEGGEIVGLVGASDAQRELDVFRVSAEGVPLCK